MSFTVWIQGSKRTGMSGKTEEIPVNAFVLFVVCRYLCQDANPDAKCNILTTKRQKPQIVHHHPLPLTAEKIGQFLEFTLLAITA